MLILMKTKTPNFHMAKQHYNASRSYNFNNGTFAQYSPAYITTNEDLDWIIHAYPARGARVLTVAGSGDHPLAYVDAGAAEIDTFDISLFAQTITDIKTAALGKLNYNQYIQMLGDLRRNLSICDAIHFDQVMPILSPRSQRAMIEMDYYPIFSAGYSARFDFMTRDRYERLQKIRPDEFNFIWSDIQNLSACLSGQFDIINLSNIYEHLDMPFEDILNALRPHLTRGGIILDNSQPITNDKINAYRTAAARVREWAQITYRLRDMARPGGSAVFEIVKTRD